MGSSKWCFYCPMDYFITPMGQVQCNTMGNTVAHGINWKYFTLPMCPGSSTLHSPTLPSGLQLNYWESKWTVRNMWDLNHHSGVLVESEWSLSGVCYSVLLMCNDKRYDNPRCLPLTFKLSTTQG